MILPRDIGRLVVAPTETLRGLLAEPAAPHRLLVGVVTPLAAIRPLAFLLRSLAAGAPVPGLVRAAAALALNLGFWVVAALALERLARQLSVVLSPRQCFALLAWASAPLFCAGVLDLLPETPLWLGTGTRVAMGLVALLGVVILHRGLVVLEVRQEARLPLLAATSVGAAVTYLLLSVIVGLMASVVLYFLR